MRRRPCPDRRVCLRRAAITRLSREYRMMVIATAAVSRGSPVDVADAIDRAYTAIQRRGPWTARRMHPREVSRLTETSFKFAVALSLKNLQVQSPAVVEHGAQLRDLFTSGLRVQWGPALKRLRILHEVAWEAGRAFHDAATGRALHEVLARLHARGLALVAEILCLLENGFASGAMARWRTLHETTVVAVVLRDGGEEQARRFLDHDAVGRLRQAREYQLRAVDLASKPIPADVFVAIEADRDRMAERYGPRFGDDYGWANEPGNEAHISFRHLEAMAAQDHLRPYYQMANNPVHAGARGLLWELGTVDHDVLVTGSSDRGLADPGQLTARTLSLLTRTFVLSQDDAGVRWAIYVDALDQLSRQASDAFLEVHRDSSVESGTLGLTSAAVPGSPSLLAWPQLGVEYYASALEGATRRLERAARRKHNGRRFQLDRRRRIAARSLATRGRTAIV
jgi:Family of unknown function (DUF5677)